MRFSRPCPARPGLGPSPSPPRGPAPKATRPPFPEALSSSSPGSRRRWRAQAARLSPSQIWFSSWGQSREAFEEGCISERTERLALAPRPAGRVWRPRAPLRDRRRRPRAAPLREPLYGFPAPAHSWNGLRKGWESRQRAFQTPGLQNCPVGGGVDVGNADGEEPVPAGAKGAWKGRARDPARLCPRESPRRRRERAALDTRRLDGERVVFQFQIPEDSSLITQFHHHPPFFFF